jgi:hypothetical protein
MGSAFQGWTGPGRARPRLTMPLMSLLRSRMGPAVYGALAGSILVPVIWVPYPVRSRRVEAAFVR